MTLVIKTERPTKHGHRLWWRCDNKDCSAYGSSTTPGPDAKGLAHLLFERVRDAHGNCGEDEK